MRDPLVGTAAANVDDTCAQNALVYQRTRAPVAKSKSKTETRNNGQRLGFDQQKGVLKMHTIEICLLDRDLAAEMAEMRMWRDDHGYEPSILHYQHKPAG